MPIDMPAADASPAETPTGALLPSAPTPPDPVVDAAAGKRRLARWRYGLIAVGLGVGGLVVAFALAVAFVRSDTTTEVALIGAVAAPIVSLVTAYFGIQASAK